MNYEIANELYNAGFVFGKRKEGEQGIAFNGISAGVPPSLSELIMACGDSFLGLCKWDEDSGPEKKLRWYASTRIRKNTSGLYWGDTPEGAVANLWIALNKK